MIELYFWPTPNGYKPLIALEEFQLPYQIVPLNIFQGEQFSAEYLSIAPNNRIPAIVDHAPADGGKPLTLFESGAILHYLSRKADKRSDRPARVELEESQWLFWQMGGLGPMMGQASHFINYAPEDVPYARSRYLDETRRLVGVMEKRLGDREYLAGDYSIADMAAFPWVRLHDIVGIEIARSYPALADWVARIERRPAVVRAYAAGEPLKAGQVLDAAARKYLFGQGQL